MKLLIDHNIPFLTVLTEFYKNIRYFDGVLTRHDLGDAEALLVRTRTPCRAGLLEGSAVKFIGTATIGTDHIDMDYCRRKGITVANAAGCNAPAVMQYVVRVLFELVHQQHKPFSGLTLGIVGAGHVGTLVASAARALGMHVLINDPPRALREGTNGFTELHRLLEQSDVVTLHVPLQNDTLRMAGNTFFDTMRKGAAFINTSRGEIVDEDSLLRHRNKLGAVVLDVWAREPHINIPLLRATDIATCHIAGYSLQGKRRASEMMLEALSRVTGDKLRMTNDELRMTNDELQVTGGEGWNDELYLVINKIFPIFEVDKQLRESPGNFEQLRNNYPLRNDFSACTVTVQQRNRQPEQVLRTLGFSV